MSETQANERFHALIKKYTTQLDKSVISALPPYEQHGREVVLVEDDNIVDAIAVLQQAPYLGFDTESKPTFKKGEKISGVALIQLCTINQCYLFQINKLANIRVLSSIIDNPNIKKVGVGLRDDLNKLRTRHQFQPANCIDLGAVFKRLGRRNSIGSKQMVGLVLNKQLRKSKRMTTSNWAAQELSQYQLEYAADDAFSSLDVFFRLRETFIDHDNFLDQAIIEIFDL